MFGLQRGAVGQSPVAQQVLLNRRQRHCPVLLECTIKLPEKLGARFVQSTHRSRESLNLTVVQELQPSGLLAVNAPQLQHGMVLSRIGGDSVVGQEHSAVMDALLVRPLLLTFVDSLHKVMRVVTDGDLRAAFDFAMSVRNAHSSGGGGAAHSAAAATAALASSAQRRDGKVLSAFEKRQDDALTVRRDLTNELRMTPGDAELTLWLNEVEEICRELDAVARQPDPVVHSVRPLRAPPQAAAPKRSADEIRRMVDTQMAKATVTADRKWMEERKKKIRVELTEVDELGSLQLNAGRRLEILRVFFDKHDPARDDETVKALWETNGGKCSDAVSAYALEEDNLSFSDLLDRLAREFGEDPLKYYLDEQRKRLRLTQLSAHRLQRHAAAIQEAEDVYVKSAVEAKAVDEAVATMRQRLAGTGEGLAPRVEREPHTVTVKFWSDEKPMGLSLEYWHSVARLGHRYVRITGIASDSLADEIPELEKGMTIEAINDIAPHEMRDSGSHLRALDTIYQALRQRPVLVTFGFRIAEQAEEKGLQEMRMTQAAVRDYAGMDEKTIAAKLRAFCANGANGNGGLIAFDELDVNGDGQVSRLEYLQVLEKKRSQVAVESVRDRERAREREERTVAARRQEEAREVSHAVHELRKAALSEDVKLMQSTLADYEGFENQDVALAWEALEVALIETKLRSQRKDEEATERAHRLLQLEQEAGDRKRRAERQLGSPARERAAAEITAHTLASRAKREDEREAAQALLAEAKLEGRRRAAIAIAADPVLRQVPSPRMGFTSLPPSPPHGSAEGVSTTEMAAEGTKGGLTHRVGRIGSGIAPAAATNQASSRGQRVLNGSERWALSGSLAESYVHADIDTGSSRSVASGVQNPGNQTQQPPPLPTRSAVRGDRSMPLQLRPSSLSHTHVPTDRGADSRKQRTQNLETAMKETDAFEQMDRSDGLRRERRGARTGSPGRAASGLRYGSPGRSTASGPGRSYALSGAISNDDDDSSDGEPMPGITKRRPPEAPYRGHKLAQQSWRPSGQGSSPGDARDHTSEGESTSTQPPPPPNMPPPPSVIARGPPPPSLPTRDRKQSMSDDSNDYSTEAEMTRLNQRAFVPSRRRRSPSRNAGWREEPSPSRSTNRHTNADTGITSRHTSLDRNRNANRGRERNSSVHQDRAVIVMPRSDTDQLNYDSALSF